MIKHMTTIDLRQQQDLEDEGLEQFGQVGLLNGLEKEAIVGKVPLQTTKRIEPNGETKIRP